jgi:hypothetical protein
MNVKNLVRWKVAREIEVYGDKLIKCRFGHHKSHVSWPGKPDVTDRGGTAPEHAITSVFFFDNM